MDVSDMLLSSWVVYFLQKVAFLLNNLTPVHPPTLTHFYESEGSMSQRAL